MLVIRKEQFDAFRQYKKDVFYKELEKLLVENNSEYQNVPSKELRISVLKSCENAKNFQIDHPDSIRRFIKYVGIYGVDFGNTKESSWAKPVLEKWANSSDRLNEIDRLYQNIK